MDKKEKKNQDPIQKNFTIIYPISFYPKNSANIARLRQIPSRPC